MMILNNFCINIQKHFRGYYCRRLLKNIYFKLPDDIQRKVIFYMREQYLIEHHHHKIIKEILKRKFTSYNMDKMKYIVYQYCCNNLINKKYINYCINNLSYYYRLYTKYIELAPFDNLIKLANNRHYFTELMYRCRHLFESNIAKSVIELKKNILEFNSAYLYINS